jgi:hypothetical protein
MRSSRLIVGLLTLAALVAPALVTGNPWGP